MKFNLSCTTWEQRSIMLGDQADRPLDQGAGAGEY